MFTADLAVRIPAAVAAVERIRVVAEAATVILPATAGRRSTSLCSLNRPGGSVMLSGPFFYLTKFNDENIRNAACNNRKLLDTQAG